MTRVQEVFVVVPPRALLLDIAGPVEVLRKANLVQDQVRFAVRYIGPSPALLSSVGLTVADIQPLPAGLPDHAMVIVSGAADQPLGAEGVGATDASDEAAIVAWLRHTIRPGIRLVTICSGALLAGRAGLLDGRECTTHHATIETLRTLAPAARVRENRLYVEDGECLTSAGITAGIDLMLALIAAEVGPGVALSVARYLVVYLRRAGADPQVSPWLEGRNHLHPVVHRAQDAVAADPARDWSVAALAAAAHTSERSLSRLFNDHAGMSITAYVNRLRLALARELLLTSRLDMEAIATRTGFASPRQLRRAWSRLYDHPPTALRRGG
ncbi:MAG: helix-turn-helix domain-containing protein [Alphaproteobacteria bacterium]|nr:MAG: helix-turn-helix domain-containing protein [Alphaproteobacteria bacterium]